MLSPLSDPLPRMDAEWSYDPVLGRFRRPSGRFMSEEAVSSLVDGRVNKLGKDLKRFTRMLVDGNITIDQWQLSVRDAIKGAHIQSVVLGYGGLLSTVALVKGFVLNIAIYKTLQVKSWQAVFQLLWLWLAFSCMRNQFVAATGRETPCEKPSRATP